MLRISIGPRVPLGYERLSSQTMAYIGRLSLSKLHFVI